MDSGAVLRERKQTKKSNAAKTTSIKEPFCTSGSQCQELRKSDHLLKGLPKADQHEIRKTNETMRQTDQSWFVTERNFPLPSFSALHRRSRTSFATRRVRLMHITSLHCGRYMVQLVVHRAEINYSLAIVHLVLNLNPSAETLISVFNLFLFLISFVILFFPSLPFTASMHTNKQGLFEGFLSLLQKQRDCVLYVNRPAVFLFFPPPIVKQANMIQ